MDIQTFFKRGGTITIMEDVTFKHRLDAGSFNALGGNLESILSDPSLTKEMETDEETDSYFPDLYNIEIFGSYEQVDGIGNVLDYINELEDEL